jgi:hypothetical protein
VALGAVEIAAEITDQLIARGGNIRPYSTYKPVAYMHVPSCTERLRNSAHMISPFRPSSFLLAILKSGNGTGLALSYLRVDYNDRPSAKIRSEWLC